MAGNADKATVVSHTGSFDRDHDYVVTGSPEDVIQWYWQLCGQYRPAGYGTRGRWEIPDKPGNITLYAWHAHSCG